MTAPAPSVHIGQVSTLAQAPKTAPKTAPAPGRSLAERRPDIASDWDVAGNGELTPADVTFGSSHTVSWTCPAGHGPYLMKVSARTGPGHGCRACAKVKFSAPKKGKTLADAFPDVAAEWDYEANHPLTPSDVAARSNKKAYFICAKGHGSTLSYISNRTAGNGCPECGRQRSGHANVTRALARGTLAEVNPALAAQWNTEMNTLTPSEVGFGSTDRVWWNCREGHEPFLASVGSRHRGGVCPACANIRRAAAIRYAGPKPGTSVAEMRPDLIPGWDYERNTLTPYDVSAGSRKIVHWVCPDGHRYELPVVRRAAVASCPVERAQRKAARAA